MPVIIHKDLSYAVKGACFDVHNALGPLLPEKFYQAALAIALEEWGICCETEKSFEVYYRGVRMERYFPFQIRWCSLAVKQKSPALTRGDSTLQVQLFDLFQ